VTAIVVAAIASVGAWIAALQMLLAHEKLKMEAFDRRYEKRLAVFQATRGILMKAYDHHKPLSEDEIKQFGLQALDAEFLFDKTVYDYAREVHFHVGAFCKARRDANASPPSDERTAFELIERDHLNWIRLQGHDMGFSSKFRPFLEQPQIKRPWWRPWPD
jgi:hypothetical protein